MYRESSYVNLPFNDSINQSLKLTHTVDSYQEVENNDLTIFTTDLIFGEKLNKANRTLPNDIGYKEFSPNLKSKDVIQNLFEKTNDEINFILK